MRKFIAILAGMAGACALASSAPAQTVLKASHQFPGGKGDPRDEMVQIIAKEARSANVGLDVQVYPGASLFKPNDQWNALVNGQLDISSFPLDYASGKVRDFGATLMPGLVRNHERAQRINDSPFMKEVKAKIDRAGVVVLADAWLAGSSRLCVDCNIHELRVVIVFREHYLSAERGAFGHDQRLLEDELGDRMRAGAEVRVRSGLSPLREACAGHHRQVGHVALQVIERALAVARQSGVLVEADGAAALGGNEAQKIGFAVHWLIFFWGWFR